MRLFDVSAERRTLDSEETLHNSAVWHLIEEVAKEVALGVRKLVFIAVICLIGVGQRFEKVITIAVRAGLFLKLSGQLLVPFDVILFNFSVQIGHSQVVPVLQQWDEGLPEVA